MSESSLQMVEKDLWRMRAVLPLGPFCLVYLNPLLNFHWLGTGSQSFDGLDGVLEADSGNSCRNKNKYVKSQHVTFRINI